MDIDSKIIELFDVVSKRKAEVEETESTIKKSWKTTCSIKLPWMGTNANIQTASIELLEEITAYLIQVREAKKLLNLNHSIQGFEYFSWIEDIQKRIAVIENRSKKSELEQLEKRLNSIVSPEQKRQMELKAIMDSLA